MLLSPKVERRGEVFKAFRFVESEVKTAIANKEFLETTKFLAFLALGAFGMVFVSVQTPRLQP